MRVRFCVPPVLLFLGCHGVPPEPTAPTNVTANNGEANTQSKRCDEIATVIVEPNEVKVLVGEVYGIDATVVAPDGEELTVPINWAVDSPGVDVVSGSLVASSDGGYTLTASAVVEDCTVTGEIDVKVEKDKFFDLSVGEVTACALQGNGERGRAYCWGLLFQPDPESEPVVEPFLTRVDTDLSFSEIAVGARHVCALSEDREKVYCWGEDEYCQLGRDCENAERPRPIVTPIEVTMPLEGPYTHLAAGDSHSCVIKEDNQILCWGRNHVGQASVADGSSSPLQSPHHAIMRGNAHVLGLGSTASCYIEDEPPGDVYCWGSDNTGEHGDGPDNSNWTNTLVPLEEVVDLDARRKTHCALSEAGTVYCWGLNNRGKIDGSPDETHHSPVERARDASAMTMGRRHSCVVGLDPIEVECRGEATTFTAMRGDMEFDVTGLLGPNGNLPDTTFEMDEQVRAIDAGDYHTCVLTEDERIFCWGDNTVGQLGNGTTEDAVEPVRAVAGQ